MFEHRSQPLLPRHKFVQRMVNYAAAGFAMVLLSLLIGIIGYHGFENLSWLDSLLNASMILGGMGPVHELRTTGGKLFASFYALYSGLVLLAFAGIIFTPLFHRLLHKFHLEQKNRNA